jgi:exosome complex component RRP4
MRSFFQEGDLLSAEVQAFFGDGAASLHTRNMNKYGKLRNGTLVVVPSALIKRSKSHFVNLSCGVDLVLGLNGYIYVQKHVLANPDMLYSNSNGEISSEERLLIARVCNIVQALADNRMSIYDSIIDLAVKESMKFSVKDLCSQETRKLIVENSLKLLGED